MLATNPTNGKPIRIMNSDASIWKDSKTLTFMKEPYSPDMRRWRRWDILVTSASPEFLAWKPDIVLLTDESLEANLWIKTEKAKKIRFILVSLKAIKTLTSQGFDVSTLGNVICLEEFESMYPFLGEPWDGTLEDAIMCATIIFRYNKLIGLAPSHARLQKLAFSDLKLSVFQTHKAPEPLVLIQQYYKPADKTREKELKKCLEMNLKCDFVDQIILFVESANLAIPADPLKKIKQIPLKSRLTYAHCIDTIQNLIGADSLVAFANADIYFNETWRAIWSVNLADTFVALLRWEEGSGTKGPEIFGPRNDSQDTWLIHSNSVLARTWNLSAFNIPFGKAGCDNAILVEFLRNKFKIVNPAMNIQTIHVHKSEFRTYEKTDIVDRPVYMFVEPTGIHELHPLLSWAGWAGEPTPYEPLDRPLKATTPKHLAMFCSQMNRDPAFIWAAEGLNTYLPPVGQDRPIELKGGAFVSPSGLVYRHTDICVGTTDIQKSAWSDNKLSHLMASFGVDSMMSFHLESAWLEQPALFTLHYLSKVIQQNKVTPNASFWCKKTNGLLAAIHLFKWEKAQGRLLEYSEQTQAFAQTVVGRSCHGTRPVKADIDTLREAMNGKWNPSIDSGADITVIVQDTYHMNGDLVERLSKNFTATKTIWCTDDAKVWAQALSGATRVILSSSVKNIKHQSWAWLWLAPVGCKILELQEEREPSDSLVHLAAAAGLEWTLLQYPRSTAEGFKRIVEKEVGKWGPKSPEAPKPDELEETPISVEVTDTIPTIIQTEAFAAPPTILTPPRSMKHGFFGHKGDSFRELIDLWEEKGLVVRKEDPALTQCWLGEVGGILLYDRPTWAWLDKAPAPEQIYKVCLAGNPDHSEKPSAKPWIFWPRQPRLVEEMALIPRKSFDDRTDNMVFFGRIENDVQASYRTKEIESWSSICNKFSMQQGKEPYALSPKEYLEALQNAKYGLCLRGYGPKCNREIELLAMGTVPVVTSDVDFSNYAEPLINGVHVILVRDKADAMEKLSYGMSEEKWNEISEAGFQWWKRNCSVEGSWAQTKVHYE
uniref:Exostosin GT47 domain-containing protein n=1 Tax=viral metagenome TaxID=1070528 RepID=A0A6C0ANP3_9ZZZZ